MAKLSKRERVLRWFFSEPLSPGVLSFDDLALIAARSSLDTSASQAESYVQRYINSLWECFVEQCKKESKIGIYPVAKIIDYKTRKIISTTEHLKSLNCKRSYRVAGRLNFRPSIFQTIDRIDDRSYEALCCLFCKKIGAKYVHLTPPGNEGGIDFVALIEASKDNIGFNGLNNFKIVGQAKKYKGTVTVGDIRDFNDTLSDVRRLSPSVKDHLPDWFKETHAPIVGWMVGHNGFQSGCETKSKMNGIMLMDSKRLTEALAFSTALGHLESPTVVADRMLVELQEILKFGS